MVTGVASLPITTGVRPSDLQRRLVYLMFFRTILISLVLGATLVLSWLSDVDLASPSSLALFSLIALTYLLTLVYVLLLRKLDDPRHLGMYQLAADLAIATVLIHVTGGAQSAYTFFLPLAVIGAAILYFEKGAILMGAAALTLFVSIALLGWSGTLALPDGSRVLPTEQSSIEFARSLGLNVAAIFGLSLLATNLGSQLHRASDRIQSQASAAADLLTLHQDIVRSLAIGLMTTNPEGTIHSANRSACEILGLPQAELVGAALGSVLPKVVTAHETTTRGSPARLEVARERDGHPQILSVSVSPLFDHRDEVIGQIVNFQDMTELRHMEEQVQQSERLAMIGELAAGVAHEIRNPLASISGSVELLRSTNPAGDEDSRTLMDIVIREIDRLNSLISELLDYASPRPPQTSSVDLVALCKETIRVCRQDPRFESIEFSFNQGEVNAVEGDPEKLRQVLWNLLRNAAESVDPTSGRVGVELSSNSKVVLKVFDNGPGIPEDAIERIFHPFFTTKARGSGLGLAMVHAIISQHKGTISAANRPEGGAEFVVCLARGDASSASAS